MLDQGPRRAQRHGLCPGSRPFGLVVPTRAGRVASWPRKAAWSCTRSSVTRLWSAVRRRTRCVCIRTVLWICRRSWSCPTRQARRSPLPCFVPGWRRGRREGRVARRWHLTLRRPARSPPGRPSSACVRRAANRPVRAAERPPCGGRRPSERRRPVQILQRRMPIRLRCVTAPWWSCSTQQVSEPPICAVSTSTPWTTP